MSIATAQARVSALPIRRDDVLRKWLPLVLILGAAVAVRHFVIANTDVSYAITLSEKVLDGQRLYTDLIEVNPPASTFLYLPAVVLARMFGLAPELVVDSLVFIGALVSLGITAGIIRHYRLLDGLSGWSLATFTLAVLTILPAQTFGEREHVALIAVLPALAVLAARGNGAKPFLWHCLVAGLGAGVTICIKPHFALAVGLAVTGTALYLRSWRVLFVLENWIAAAIVVAYGICIVVFYRSYITDVMPLVADLYLPVRAPFLSILASTPVMLWAGAILAVFGLMRGYGFHSVFLVLLTASAGFAAAYLIQGKGWSYHSYPMLALALIALDLAATRRRFAVEQAGNRDGLQSVCATLILGFVAVWSFAWLNVAVDARAAAAVVGRIAPPHPSLIVISDDVAIGHPLVRAVGGRWISRSFSLWVTQNAAILSSAGNLDAMTARRLFAYAQADRQQLIGEIRDGKPDIILVDTRPGRIVADNRAASWSEWVKADGELSALIAANYREVDNAEDVAILKRNGT
jgi:hypothetical protein